MTAGTVNKGDVKVHLRPTENEYAGSVLKEGAVVDLITHNADGSWILVSPRFNQVAAQIGWVETRYVSFDRDAVLAGEHAELSDAQLAEIVKAVQQWVTGHPNADEPLTLVRGKVLSPRALANEMAERTELGRPFLDYLAHEAARTGQGITEPIYSAITANQSR